MTSSSRQQGQWQGNLLAHRYKVGKRLGVGGAGEVYEALQVDLGRKVAVKILHSELAKRQDCLSRLELEARAAAGLGHPNIVQVTDFYSKSGEVAFLVMELLRGRSMEQVIREEGPLPAQRVAFIARQVLSALEEAHGAGIVHRDMKPENIMLTSITGVQDIVKLLDFGIAKLIDDTGTTRLTATGFNPGTPAFMSPEQAKGAEVDERTDIYSFGVVMYNALCRRLPYSGANYNAMTYAILHDDPPPLRELLPGLDPGLVAVVERAMARDPEQRYTTAKDMGRALDPWSRHSVGTSSEPTPDLEEAQAGPDDAETIVTPPPGMNICEPEAQAPEVQPVTSVMPVDEALFGTPEQRDTEKVVFRDPLAPEPKAEDTPSPTPGEADEDAAPDIEAAAALKTTTLTRSAGERRRARGTWRGTSLVPMAVAAAVLLGLGLFLLLGDREKPAPRTAQPQDDGQQLTGTRQQQRVASAKKPVTPASSPRTTAGQGAEHPSEVQITKPRPDPVGIPVVVVPLTPPDATAAPDHGPPGLKRTGKKQRVAPSRPPVKIRPPRVRRAPVPRREARKPRPRLSPTKRVPAKPPQPVQQRPPPIKPEKAKPRLGALRIGAANKEGSPVWAEVLVDGVVRGKTPVVVKGLKPGSHWISIRRKGRPSVTRHADVVAGETASVFVELQE